MKNKKSPWWFPIVWSINNSLFVNPRAVSQSLISGCSNYRVNICSHLMSFEYLSINGRHWHLGVISLNSASQNVRSSLFWCLRWGCPEGVKLQGPPALFTRSWFFTFVNVKKKWKKQGFATMLSNGLKHEEFVGFRIPKLYLKAWYQPGAVVLTKVIKVYV